MKISHLIGSIFLIKTLFLLGIILIGLVLVYPQEAIVGEIWIDAKTNLNGTAEKIPNVSAPNQEIKNIIQAPERAPIPSQAIGGDVPVIAEAVPYPYPFPTWAQFSLQWTHCQIHRVETDSAIVVTLNGSILSSNNLIWNLATAPTPPGSSPSLYFVEDIFGRSGPQYGSDIMLNWEISLDGGQLNPMNVLPDGSLSVLFPAGTHTFQVRITGAPQYHQADGYYHLQLDQSLAPEL